VLQDRTQSRSAAHTQSFAETGVLGRRDHAPDNHEHRAQNNSSATREPPPHAPASQNAIEEPRDAAQKLEPAMRASSAALTSDVAPDLHRSQHASHRVATIVSDAQFVVERAADPGDVEQAVMTLHERVTRAFNAYAARRNASSPLSLSLHQTESGAHVYARTAQMDDADRARLKDDIAALLAAYGLKPAAFVLNGAPLPDFTTQQDQRG
ncbi:MAG: hypothetical protein ABW199_13070, partial [Caulobacterales bacterium]